MSEKTTIAIIIIGFVILGVAIAATLHTVSDKIDVIQNQTNTTEPNPTPIPPVIIIVDNDTKPAEDNQTGVTENGTIIIDGEEIPVIVTPPFVVDNETDTETEVEIDANTSGPLGPLPAPPAS